MAPSVKRAATASPYIAVSGSLAFDQIMDFPGKFGDHILPRQTHNLNISFLVGSLRQSDGGTAGNIAYNLALLGERPTILGVAGPDFLSYRERLAKSGADTRRIKIEPLSKTASAYIITDQEDNQIAAFYPGPQVDNYARSVVATLRKLKLAVIAPDDKRRMLDYASAYQAQGVPYIFDPGQQVIAFSGPELRCVIGGARILIGNDYEMKLISGRMKISASSLRRLTEIVVETRGGQGSYIYSLGKKIVVKPARPLNTSDPTGAGDAYRAGFIKGLLTGRDLKTCGQLASVAAVYTVEKFGTQTHRYTKAEFCRRYQNNYKEAVKI